MRLSPVWPFGDSRVTWRVMAALFAFPAAAVLHHAVFFRGMCMLNRVASDYSPGIMLRLFARDPSLIIAIAISLLVYYAGRRTPWFRTLVTLGLVASLPITLWLWDIPLTGRWICRSYHDGRLILADGMALTTRWFYLIGVILFLVLLVVRQWASRQHRGVAELTRSQAGGRTVDGAS